jgi:dipeptidyl aminopeptidase/acylaminoacyl peptidase
MSPDEYLDALLSLPGMVAPSVSPDGRWVAWTWFRAGPAADVYAAPTDASTPPVRLTDTPENTLLVAWTPDSRAVLVQQDTGGDERAQLFRVDLDAPLLMTPLTEAHPSYFLRGGNLHPNGRWLVYGANVDLDTGEEIEPTWIYRQDLETGERTVLARPAKPGYLVPKLSPSGEHILYPRKDLHPAGLQYWLVGIDGSDDRETLSAGPDAKVSASWFPDGRRILVLAEMPTHRRLGVWSLDTSETRWLLDDPARNIEQAYVPFGSEEIVVVEVRQARPRAKLLDPVTGAERPFPDHAGNLIPLAPTPDGAWVAFMYSARQPHDLVRFRLDDPRPVSLARVWERTPLTANDLTPAENVTWTAADGLAIHGWLYRAEAPVRGTIVYVHGGPTAHSPDAINPQIQFFARAGYTVLDPNYRGSTGYGMAFREAIKVDGWGGREQDDIRDGVAALVERGIAAPGKVGITGTSYGGYSSWHAITHFPPEVVAAAAPVCGMTDLVVDYETTRPDLRPYSEEMLGGRPDQVPERYRERSPIHFVGDIRGRLLIVQGEQDPNVTPENVRAVRAELDRTGVAYDVLTFPDEGHGISKPRNQKRLYAALARFFDFGTK